MLPRIFLPFFQLWSIKFQQIFILNAPTSNFVRFQNFRHEQSILCFRFGAIIRTNKFTLTLSYLLAFEIRYKNSCFGYFKFISVSIFCISIGQSLIWMTHLGICHSVNEFVSQLGIVFKLVSTPTFVFHWSQTDCSGTLFKRTKRLTFDCIEQNHAQ